MKYHIQLTDIKKDIEEIFEIPDLADRYRGRELVMCRYLYFILSRKYTYESLAKIGAKVDRDHAQVIHGLTKYDDLIKYFKGHKYVQEELEKRYRGREMEMKTKEFNNLFGGKTKKTILTKKQMELQLN